ncbi:hypothetical protein TSPI_08834 [Trichinella spiralis]|uniref:Uncharacterized protein n=1 Tax=Trichinella spiralis TaxID=6334 RepID=A0ABR3KP43_TRISP
MKVISNSEVKQASASASALALVSASASSSSSSSSSSSERRKPTVHKKRKMSTEDFVDIMDLSCSTSSVIELDIPYQSEEHLNFQTVGHLDNFFHSVPKNDFQLKSGIKTETPDSPLTSSTLSATENGQYTSGIEVDDPLIVTSSSFNMPEQIKGECIFIYEAGGKRRLCLKVEKRN